jgi:hypothetical protein
MHSTHTAEYNPLFAKMQARFCVGGTIAEKMEKQAAVYRKDTKVKTFSDYHAACLDPRTECKEKKERKSFSFKLTLRPISTACMALLIGGTLLFSGATLGSMLSEDEGGVDVFVSEKASQVSILDEGTPTEDVPDTASFDEV